MPREYQKIKRRNKNEEISKNEEENSYQNSKNNTINKPMGLYNLGLTCYMNSLLQCFFHIIELRNYFIENRNKYKEDKLICKELSNVMYQLNCKNKTYFKPNDFKKAIAGKNKLFKGTKAADVKDLFFNIMDSLSSELNEINSRESSLAGEIDFSKKEEIFKLTEKEFYSNNFINQLFLGFYETKYLCPNMEKNKRLQNKHIYSFQIESFILFELEKIKNYYNKDLSLDLCFQYFTKYDNEKSSFFCSLCNKTHINKFQNIIYKPPKVLVIVLERGRGKKFKEKVEFSKMLDLKNYIDKDSKCKNTLYKLICISTHKGDSSEYGHYIAYCLNDNGKYYLFNDSYVQEIQDEKEIYEDDPYLLFYQREENNNNQTEENMNDSSIIEENETDKLKIDLINKVDNQTTFKKFNLSKENKYYKNKEVKNNNSNQEENLGLKYSKKDQKKVIEISNKQNENINNTKEKDINSFNKTKIVNDSRNKRNNYYAHKKLYNYKYLQKFDNKSLNKNEISKKNEIKDENIYIFNKNNSSKEKKINNENNIESLNKIKNKKIKDVDDKLIFLDKILNILIEENKSSKKYIVDYHPSFMKNENVWKLTIIGPKNTIYENENIDFKFNAKLFKFKDFTHSTCIERKIYHLNFYKSLNDLPFNFKYNTELSFYDNIKNFFNFIYELFSEPNVNIWVDINKINLYQNKREIYDKSAKEALKCKNEDINNEI